MIILSYLILSQHMSPINVCHLATLAHAYVLLYCSIAIQVTYLRMYAGYTRAIQTLSFRDLRSETSGLCISLHQLKSSGRSAPFLRCCHVRPMRPSPFLDFVAAMWPPERRRLSVFCKMILELINPGNSDRKNSSTSIVVYLFFRLVCRCHAAAESCSGKTVKF